MNYYIKKWPQNTATVFDENGAVIWTFTSVEEAAPACMDTNQYPEKNANIDINIAA